MPVIGRTALVVAASVAIYANPAHGQAPPPLGCEACGEQPLAQPTTGPLEAQPRQPPPPEAVTVPRRKTLLEKLPQLGMRFELGGVYTRALERNFGGARLDFELGYEREHFAIGGRSGLEVGSTQSGLSYERFSWGVGIDGRVGPLRIGLEPRVGGIVIQRVSSQSALGYLVAPTYGIHAECIIALYGAGNRRSRDHMALDLILRAGYDRMDVTNGNFDAANTAQVKLGLGGRY